MKKFYVLVNPSGGQKKGLKILQQIQPIFAENGAELTVLETGYPGHARDYAREVDFHGYDGLCAIGGDGTIHEMVNGMLSRTDGDTLPLGPIPGGTGNSFLHDIDCLQPKIAVQRIVQGDIRSVDLARVDTHGKRFFAFNIVGWGMSTEANFFSEKMRWLGGIRYNLGAVLTVLRSKNRMAKLVLDEQTEANNFAMILACNTAHTGKGLKMAPLAKLNDGLIDLITVRKTSRLKMLSLFTKVFNGQHVDSPLLDYRQVKRFSILTDSPENLNIDGELVGQTPVHVEIEPGKVDFLV
jgi:diacylglycerol kinase (ATP)